MPIRLSQENAALTAYLQGEIDHHGARTMMLSLDREVTARNPRTLTVDMSGVTFMDSSGIAVLLRCLRRMEETGGTLSVKGVPPQAKKVFSTAGLDKLIPMSS